MDKLEMAKAGVVALVRYTGSLQGYTHKNSKTGNVHTFIGPKVFTKLYSLEDAEFYKSKESFEVEMLVVQEDDILISEDPEPLKEEPGEDKTEVEDETVVDEEVPKPVSKAKSKKKPSQSNKSKLNNKGKANKGGIK